MEIFEVFFIILEGLVRHPVLTLLLMAVVFTIMCAPG